MPRRVLPILAAIAALVLVQAAVRVRAQPRRMQLLLVVDGLRPDQVTPGLMPRLHALGRRGISFAGHHSVFPTVTRVNASSIATGAYPETHGLLGNTVYSPRTFPARGINTSDFRELQAMLDGEGALITAPSLATLLQQAGRRLVVFSGGSSGSAMLLGYPEAASTIVNGEFVRPAALEARIVDALGAPPAEASPNNALNRWVVDAFLRFGLSELRGDVTAIWFGDPDHTAHDKGLDAPPTRQALRFVDEEVGRIEDALRSRGQLASTNIVVTSDHGFSTHTGTLRLAALVEPFARPLPDGTPDIVVTEGAVNVRGPRDPARVQAIVAELQRRPEVGAIFTRPRSRGGTEGVIAGTLSFSVARWEHPRSADILVSANWDRGSAGDGLPGRTTQGGAAGHGTSSPYDIHNVLVAAGPDFRSGAISEVPTSNADLAPTLLTLAGVPVPSGMTGRPIREALTSGPRPTSVRVDRQVVTAATPDGSYTVQAHLSLVDGHQYLDYTEVRRK